MKNFFDGNTAIRLNYAFVNNAWLVWREDAGHQSGLRVYNDYAEAESDFNARVSFYREVVCHG